MTYNEFKTKVKSLLLYDQESDDVSAVNYVEALIREWMSDIQYFVENYRIANENIYLPASIDPRCEGGLIELPIELSKLSSVSIVKRSEADEFIVSGAGSAVVNGKYVKDEVASGANNVYVKYDTDGTTPLMAIYYSLLDSKWYIIGYNPDDAFPYTFPVTFGVSDSPYEGLSWPYYEATGESIEPPVDGWSSFLGGVDPTPVIAVDSSICTSVVDLEPISWSRRNEIKQGDRCNAYAIDPRATEVVVYPRPEDDPDTGEKQWLRVEWDGTKVEYDGEEKVPYGDDAVKNCADMINWNLALKKEDKPARSVRFEKLYLRGRTRLFKTQEEKSQQR